MNVPTTPARPVDCGARLSAAEVQAVAPRLDKWRAAVAKLRAGSAATATLLCVGDSNTAGYDGTYTDKKRSSYPTRLAQMLDACGLGAQEASFVSTNTGDGSAGPTYDPRMALGSGWAALGSPPTLAGLFWANSTTTTAFAFTPTQSFDRIEVFYSASTGSFTVDVDGGAVLLTVPGGGGPALVKSTVNCTAGTHTVNLKRVSGAVYIYGINVYSSTAPKISVINAGLGGTTSTALANNGDAAFKPTKILEGIGAHVVVLNIGINDIVAGTPAATYEANLTTVVTSAQTGGADVILCAPMPFSDANYASLMPQYIAALKAVATAKGCFFVDAINRYTSYANSNALGLQGSALHPNAAGYADYAAMVCEVLRRFTPPALS